MKKVKKSSRVAALFREHIRQKGYKNWNEFATSENYYRYRKFILKYEQNFLSAYTEKYLDEEKMELHIDHFRKKSMYPKLTFVHENLFVDERNNNYGACYKDNSSGIHMEGFDGRHRILNPHLESLAPYLTFDMSGNVYAVKLEDEDLQKRVEETIRVFNLKHRELNSRRAELIKEIGELRSGGLSDEEIRGCLDQRGFPTLIDWAIAWIP